MYSLVIVDDELVVRDGLAYHFPWEKHGFKVKAVFACPKQALTFLTKNTTDVLLTDIRMPFMSGLDLIRQVKNLNKKVIMCLISAYREFSYAQEGMTLGVKYFLVKPTSFDEITEVFKKIKTELDNLFPESSIIPETDNDKIKKTYSIMIHKTAACSLFSIASELNLDESYLSRLFKKETGKKFRDELQRIKMDKAAEMLINPIGYKIRDISIALGYQDMQNFCRTFKKYFGTSPGNFKSRGKT